MIIEALFWLNHTNAVMGLLMESRNECATDVSTFSMLPLNDVLDGGDQNNLHHFVLEN
jgi:hypothetical protein